MQGVVLCQIVSGTLSRMNTHNASALCYSGLHAKLTLHSDGS